MQQPTTEYHNFYHLREAPFAHLRAPQSLFIGAGQQPVIEAIQHRLAARQGMIALIGETGLGKTTLVRAILAQMASPQLTSIYVDQPNLDSDALAEHIAQALGRACPEDVATEGLRCLWPLFAQATLGEQRIVLVVDDAHMMPMETLCQVGQLAIHAAAFVQVILIGQTGLADICQRSGLDKHIATLRLNPLTPGESEAYILACLAHASAGHQADVFSAGAMKAMVKYALGTPRALNMVCTDVLRSGFANRERPISAKTARSVVAEVTGRAPRRQLSLTWLGALAACALMSWVSLCLPISRSDGVGAMPAVAAVRHSSLPMPDLPDTTVGPLSMPQHVPEVAAPTPVLPQPEPPTIVSPQIAPTHMTKQDSPMPSPDGAFVPVVSILQEAFPTGGDFDLQCWVHKASGTPYEEGETLGISLQASTDAYLRIDYYQADGQVIHLLPSPLGNNRVKAGEPFVFGTPDSSLPLVIAPPFGEEMLIVIASQQAIRLPADAPPVESTEQYVARLAHDLQRIKANGKATMAFVRLHTQPRGGR